MLKAPSGKLASLGKSWKKVLREHYSLFAILLGVILVSASIAPFHNLDIDLEYETAQAVIKWGMPYYPSYGTFLNQPPLGFYIEAAFFKVFGSIFVYGVALITAFGLGTTLLVYKVGKLWYGKPTGLLAAALFAFTPWQLILSRSFLIDVPCLFFSLLSLFVGVLAIRKGSFKLFLGSGAVFAVAFLTKFYAVYALLPLALFFVYNKPRNLKRSLMWVGGFFLPLLFGFFLWYQVISGQGVLAAFSHSDLVSPNLDVVASPFFVGNFLVNSVGTLFLVSAVLSVALCFSAKKHLDKVLIFDLICLVTITIVVTLDTFLGWVLNLKPPYFSPVKYVYQSLPYLSLLSASLLGKTILLFRSFNPNRKLWKVIAFAGVAVTVFLVGTALYRNLDYARLFSTWDYIIFRTMPHQPAGYSFFSPDAISWVIPLMAVQYTGFGFVLSGLAWASRRELGRLWNFITKKRP